MHRQLCCVISLALCLSLAGTAADAKSCRGSSGKDCFLLRAPAATIPAIAASYGLTVLRSPDPGEGDLVLVSGPESLLPEVTESLVEQDPSVVGFEQVTAATVSESALESLADGTTAVVENLTQSGQHSGPEDPYFAAPAWNGYLDQPAGAQVNLAALRGIAHAEAMGSGAVVAVIDTGVDPTHPLLQGALVAGYDFLLDQPGVPSEWDSLDPANGPGTRTSFEAAAEQSYGTIVEGSGQVVYKNSATGVLVEQSYGTIVEGESVPSAFGHGTMVAGIIRMVAPAAKIMPIRAFDGDGRGDLGDIIEAIYYAIDHGANVINMSFSTAGHSEELARAIKDARKAKVLTVSSSGNSGTQNLTYPAAYGETFGVASVNSNDQLSAFSNHGSDLVTVAAPGEGVITTYPGGLLAAAWGTSFAAAFVSGTVATLHDELADGSVKSITTGACGDALELSGVQPDPANPTDLWGAGILDAFGAFGLGKVGY